MSPRIPSENKDDVDRPSSLSYNPSFKNILKKGAVAMYIIFLL